MSFKTRLRVPVVLLGLLTVGLVVPGASTEPFVGAYVHLHRVAAPSDPVEKRIADIKASVATAKALGITALLPYVADSSGRSYYPSLHHPEQVYGDWDAVGAYIEEARGADMLVYPTIPVLVSGHDEARGILARHPEWALQDETGKRYGFISAANPEARAWVVGALEELVSRYGLEGITLDYLRYPNRPMLLDAVGMANYNEATGGAPYTASDRGDTPLQRYKETQLSLLAEAIDRALPKVSKLLYTWGAHVADGHYVGQRWPDWVRAGQIDIVNASGYCYTDNYGADYMTVFRKRMTDVQHAMPVDTEARLTFCLGIVTSHGSIKAPADIQDYLAVSREEGVDGVAFFTLNTLEPHADPVRAAGYLEAYKKTSKDQTVPHP